MEDIQKLFRHSRWQQLLKTAIPCHCKVCNKTSIELICPNCLKKLHRPNFGQHCIQCASELPASLIYRPHTSMRCGTCLTQKQPFSRTVFPFYYAEPLAGLIQQFKYNNDLILTRWFAQSIVEQLISDPLDTPLPDCLVPVPLHSERLKQRGYNQSYILAKHIGKQLGIPVYKHAIIRWRHTPKQSGLNKQQRKRNLNGAFRLSNKARARLKGRNIAIVDDVITTGSTLRVVSSVLKFGKPTLVTLLAIAKTQPFEASKRIL